MRNPLSHLFFKKIDGREIQLQIVLTSGSIALSLVYKEPGEKPRVLVTRHTEVRHRVNQSGPGILKQQVIDKLSSALDELTSELGPMYELQDLFKDHQVIHSVALSLSPLWTDSEVITQELSFPEPRTIKHEDLVLHDLQNDNEIIDTRIIDAQVNGYRVDPENVAGLEGSLLTTKTKVTRLDTATKDLLIEVINQHFTSVTHTELTITPFTTTLLTGLGGLYGVREKFSLLYFDQEDSILISRDKDFVLSLQYSSYGRADLERQIVAGGLAANTSFAEDLVDMYFAGVLDGGEEKKVQGLLEVESSVLVDALLSEEVEIQQPLYGFSWGMGEKMIGSFLKTALGVSAVQLIDKNDFEEYVDFEQAGQEMSAEALFFALYLSLV